MNRNIAWWLTTAFATVGAPPTTGLLIIGGLMRHPYLVGNFDAVGYLAEILLLGWHIRRHIILPRYPYPRRSGHGKLRPRVTAQGPGWSDKL